MSAPGQVASYTANIATYLCMQPKLNLNSATMPLMCHRNHFEKHSRMNHVAC